MNPPSNFSSQMPNPPPVVKGVTHLSSSERIKLWQSAQDLESTFTAYMLKDVKFGPVQADGKQSFAADTFGDMFKQTLADQMARSNSMGLAQEIYTDSARSAEKSKLGSTIHPADGKNLPTLSSLKGLSLISTPLTPQFQPLPNL